MAQKDMRRKENKRILGTAANRDAYLQQKNVVLRDSRKEEMKHEKEKA